MVSRDTLDYEYYDALILRFDYDLLSVVTTESQMTNRSIMFVCGLGSVVTGSPSPLQDNKALNPVGLGLLCCTFQVTFLLYKHGDLPILHPSPWKVKSGRPEGNNGYYYQLGDQEPQACMVIGQFRNFSGRSTYQPITMQACSCWSPSCQYPLFPGSGLLVHVIKLPCPRLIDYP